MARKKKMTDHTDNHQTKTSLEVTIAETVQTSASMSVSIESEKQLAAEIHGEIKKDGLAAVADVLSGTDCWATVTAEEVHICGPTDLALKTSSAAVWRALSQLKKDKKIEGYPKVTTALATK